ncbi:GroES-like protein [Meredithblackwellia eburnea MCA 4105]
MSTEIPEQFTGYGAKNEADGKKLDLELITYTPKTWTENDVDIKIDFCGVCGSDLHVLTNGWPRPTSYHAIVGHEIIGTVVRAGSKSGHVVGTRVGVGAQGGSCLDCEFCDKKKEQFCNSGMIGTYQGKWEDGSIAQGGYANYTRCHGRFAIEIPEAIPSEYAAPLMCAGVTTFTPLKRFGCGPGKKVGVVGIGGLGHLALKWAEAMGAETFALSHSASKLSDAEKLGVKPENFIITKDEAAVAEKYVRSLDIIICTSSHLLPIESLYFKLLRPEGALVLCGLPEEKLPAFFGQAIVGKNLILAGSLIGSTADLKEMLALAAEKDIRPWITVRPLSEASQVVKDTEAGLARYRYVLKI